MSTAASSYAKEVPHWTWDAIWACKTDRQRRICILVQQEQFRWGDDKRHGQPVKLSQDLIAQKTGIASRNHVNNVVNELRRMGLIRTVRGSHSMTYELLRPDVPAEGTSSGTSDRFISTGDVPTEGTSDVPAMGTLDVPTTGTHVEVKSSTEALNGTKSPIALVLPSVTEQDNGPVCDETAGTEVSGSATKSENLVATFHEKTVSTSGPRPEHRESVAPRRGFRKGDRVRLRDVPSKVGNVWQVYVGCVIVLWDSGDGDNVPNAKLELVGEQVAA